ncbi:SBBP repeat-containing protein [Niastella vici]|nr:SBBP repeat-containing protein [Niastella vici]
MEKLLLKKLLLLLLFFVDSFCFAQVTPEWVARQNGPGNGTGGARSLAVDDNGNVYVTGSGTGTGLDYSTIKYNAAGVVQWESRYNGPGNDDDEVISFLSNEAPAADWTSKKAWSGQPVKKDYKVEY